ncbi:MAG: SWIB/MDM2 domain-containing protein [Myxococcales bacterium]|jgi:upstream activation factor subunit UAF30
MAKTADTKKPAAKRKPNPAFMKPMQPDAVLAKVVGEEAVPRTEIVKRLWDYIHKHNLQDPQKKTMINADANLQEVFDGKKQVTMFEMTKLVNKHMTAV